MEKMRLYLFVNSFVFIIIMKIRTAISGVAVVSGCFVLIYTYFTVFDITFIIVYIMRTVFAAIHIAAIHIIHFIHSPLTENQLKSLSNI